MNRTLLMAKKELSMLEGIKNPKSEDVAKLLAWRTTVKTLESVSTQEGSRRGVSKARSRKEADRLMDLHVENGGSYSDFMNFIPDEKIKGRETLDIIFPDSFKDGLGRARSIRFIIQRRKKYLTLKAQDLRNGKSIGLLDCGELKFDNDIEASKYRRQIMHRYLNRI